METVNLAPSITRQNCSKIAWSFNAFNFSNDIQRIISKYDVESIDCGKHSYMFKLFPSNSLTIPFAFPETNLLMQLMPNEPEQFYLKAAIREYVSTFNVFNFKGERVYPEDIV